MSLLTLPKILVKLSSSETILLDNVSSNNTNYKQITFLNILDSLQEKLQIILPAKSPDSSISKIFSEYASSTFSQSPLEKEQQVSFLLWCVKTKHHLKKNFLTNIGRSSLSIKRKIMKESSTTTTTAPQTSTMSVTDSTTTISNEHNQSSPLNNEQQKGKIKKKMVKMSDTVFSYAGECTNIDQLSNVLSSNDFLSKVDYLTDDFLFIELTPSIELSRVCMLNISPTMLCLNETLFNMQQYHKQLEKISETEQPKCGDLIGKELLNPVRVPYILRVCLKYLRDEKGVKTLGIFREAGSKRRVMELCKIFNSFMAFPEMFNQDLSIEIPSSFGVMIVADLVKHFIRNLPECLLTFDKYEEVIEMFTGRTPDKTKTLIEKVKLLMLDLPECNRSILSELMSLLHEICCNDENVTLTKMTSKNMGIVIGPNLLYLPSESDSKKLNMDEYQRFSLKTQLQHQQQTISIVCDFCQFLIENYESIFKKSSSTHHFKQLPTPRKSSVNTTVPATTKNNSTKKSSDANDSVGSTDTENSTTAVATSNTHSQQESSIIIIEQELLQKQLYEKDQIISQIKKETYLTLQKEKIIKQLQTENVSLTKENKQLKNHIETLQENEQRLLDETERPELKEDETQDSSLSWLTSLLIVSTFGIILYFYFLQ